MVESESKARNKSGRMANKGFGLRPVQFISLGFIGLILLGSFLLSTPIANASGKWESYIDSLFTATSAVCVTGLSVMDTATSFTLFGEIVILFLIQFGGLGFMTMTSVLFIIIGKKITLKERIAIAESYNQEDLQGMVRLIRMIILTTFSIEFAGAICLSFSFVPEFGLGTGVYYSVFHAVSAFCNAGFDLMGVITPNGSLTPFRSDVIVNISIMSLIILGGLGFTVLKDIVGKKGNFFKFSVHAKIVVIMTISLILLGAVMFMLFEWNNPLTIGELSFWEKVQACFFQSVSPRTAGYATLDQANLSSGGKILTMLYMFIGGSPASTAGGIKTSTFFVLMLLLISGIKQREQFICFGKSIQRRTATRAVSITLFAIFVLILSCAAISIIEIDILKKENISVETVLFECVSALSTVGLTMGITGSLSIASKLILIVLMLFGRLGTVTLGLFAFTTKNEKLNIKYPEAKILIG